MKIINFNRPLLLATASPARRDLLTATGLEFATCTTNIDETILSGETIESYVTRLAILKAESAAPQSLDSIIIAVDTAIGLGKEIIGKPDDELHARSILTKLSGNTHLVASSIAVRDIKSAVTKTTLSITKVTFVDITPHMLDWYISTGEWKARAGAYAIQGKGAALVSRVDGCFTNVIGMSVPVLMDMLGQLSD